MTPQRIAAIHRLAPMAVAAEAWSKCPAWLMIGQVCLESADLATFGGPNNFLGVKWYPGCYSFGLCWTWENFTLAELASFMIAPAPERPSRRTATPFGPTEANGKRMYHVQDYFAGFKDLQSCLDWRAARFHSGLSLPWVQAYFAPGGGYQRDWQLAHDVAIRGGYATADPDKYAEAVTAIGLAPETQDAIISARVAVPVTLGGKT